MEEPDQFGPSGSTHATELEASQTAPPTQDPVKDKKREEQLEKFLALMGPRNTARAWDNEDQAPPPKSPKGKQKAEREQVEAETDSRPPKDSKAVKTTRDSRENIIRDSS